MEFGPDLLNQAYETFFADFIGLANPLTGQEHPKMNSEEF